MRKIVIDPRVIKHLGRDLITSPEVAIIELIKNSIDAKASHINLRLYNKRHIQLLDDKFLVLAADEIRRHLEDYAEHEPNPNLWHDLLGALETEQRERATRKARKIRLCPACGKPLEVMSIADNQHSPGGFDVIAHCRNCLSDYEWFCDKDGGVSDMKQYFFG